MKLIRKDMRRLEQPQLLHGVAVLLFCLLPGSFLAQDCSNPTQLCNETDAITDSVETIAPFQFGCMNVDNVVFYEFIINNNDASNVGNAIIDITNINCPGVTDVDTLTAMVIEVVDEDLDPCDPANWVQVGDCEQDTLTISIDTGPLNGDMGQQYYVVVGSTQPPGALDCGYDIAISGPAVDINACCDEQISLGESYTMSVIGGDDPPGYSWEPPSYLDDFLIDNPTTFPEETITYVAEGSIGGCQVSDIITIFVGPPINIFNTFTPNGDGINDTWEIGGIGQFENAQINVYTRWGQLVYKNVGYAQPWDGTNDGNRLPSATYYYVIELNSLDVNIPPLTGHVVILH